MGQGPMSGFLDGMAALSRARVAAAGRAETFDELAQRAAVTPPAAASISSRCACHCAARRCFSGVSSRSLNSTDPRSMWRFSSSIICARMRIVGGS